MAILQVTCMLQAVPMLVIAMVFGFMAGLAILRPTERDERDFEEIIKRLNEDK